MKALLYTEPFRFSYTDVPDPEVGPDDVLVRVEACGICGSDVHGYTGKTGRRIPPLVMGHEASGVVEAVGSRVPDLRPGDRVCFDSTVYCNACAACRRGQYNHCRRRQVLGVSVPAFKRDGAFAEFVAVPWWIISRMPETLSFVQAALLEPVSIGVHAVRRGGVAPGDRVVVIGAGTIGLFILQAARLAGAGTVIVSDIDDARLDMARTLGADLTLNPERDALEARILEETDGVGADVSIEAVGFARTLRQAVGVTRTGGCVTLVGNLEQKAEVDVQDFVSRELTLRGSYASSGEYRDCVELVASGKIHVDPLVSQVAPLAQGQQAFDRLYRAEEHLLKIVLRPGQTA